MGKTYCVYKHTNRINGKIYIGITSQRPQKRWDCGRGYQSNKHFWDSIQKYGWESFDHEILFDNLDPEDAFRKEQELILKYGTQDYRKGYNCSSGGEGGATGLVGERHPRYGKHHTPETRARLSLANKGKKYSPERYANFLNTLDRDMLRERAYKTIVGYNNGRSRSEECRRKIAESNRGLKRSEETCKKIGESKRKSVYQMSSNGEILREWDSIKSASEVLNIQAGHISKVCKKQRKTAGGYIWRYS